MAYWTYTHATITVPDFEILLSAWKTHGRRGTLVGRFRVEKPLTSAQLRRLPAALKEILEYSTVPGRPRRHNPAGLFLVTTSMPKTPEQTL